MGAGRKNVGEVIKNIAFVQIRDRLAKIDHIGCILLQASLEIDNDRFFTDLIGRDRILGRTYRDFLERIF